MLESIPFFHRQKWGWMGHCHQGGSNWNPRPKKMVISRINRTYHQTMCVNLADLAIIWGHHCSNWQYWYQSFVTLSESPKRTHWCIMDLSLKPTASLGDRLFDTARLWILLHAALVAPAPEMLVEKSNMSRTCISHEVPQNSMVCNIPHCINKLKTCNRIVSPPKSNSYIYIHILLSSSPHGLYHVPLKRPRLGGNSRNLGISVVHSMFHGSHLSHGQSWRQCNQKEQFRIV